jgi:hypothetical protein
MPLIVAGKNPSNAVVDACNQLPCCRLIANPSQAEMDSLIAAAQIHVMPTFQQSGMKLKLLSALYGGRHVVVNPAMLYGTNMPDGACHLANTDEQFIAAINNLSKVPFTLADVEKRKELLAPYNNRDNAIKLLQLACGL